VGIYGSIRRFAVVMGRLAAMAQASAYGRSVQDAHKSAAQEYLEQAVQDIDRLHS
jgi:hypothetical protein